jgi:hypothetical protein
VTNLNRLRALSDEARALGGKLCDLGMQDAADERLLRLWERADRRHWRRWFAWRALNRGIRQ